MRTVLLVGIQYSMGHSLKWSYLERVRNHLRTGRRFHDQILMSIQPLYNMSKDMKPDNVPTFLYEQVTSPPFYLEYNSEILDRRLELGLISGEDILKLPKPSLLGYHPVYLSDEIKR